MAPRRFFGKVINVHQHEETRAPLSFDLDGERHEIQEVMSSWQDYGMPNDGRKHKWIQRHHRNYFRVRTTSDEAYEIYYDRGMSMNSPKHMKWYVTKQL